MEFQVTCPNAQSSCHWCGSLHELEDHLRRCMYRPAQCLYCRSTLPYNALNYHSQMCLNAKFQMMVQMELAASRPPCPSKRKEVYDEIVQCENADKHCPWIGRISEMRTHLQDCEMEELRPTRPKLRRLC